MAGTVNQELGLLFQGPNYVIVKKGGKAGEKVEKHNHPEARSEERRVGKECRSRWSPYH